MQSPDEQQTQDEQGRRFYRAVWRWHFYAGIFSIPFILWLSCTGAIYLFRPQIERSLDRPYDHFHLSGQQATPAHIALAAVNAVPGSSLHYFELPPNPDAAARVVVGVGTAEYRLYVHPQTLAILNKVNEDHRPMTLLAHLHGQLLAGRWGSYLVEVAASWAIVLLLTGTYLWWPRQTEKLAGVLWIRTGKGQRIFWRDLHAVTGLWVSALALFLILTGLPWANGWGAYFQWARQLTGTASIHQGWTTGRASELAARAALNRNTLKPMADMPDMPGMDDAEHVQRSLPLPAADSYEAFDRLVPLASSLHIAYPVKIMPAAEAGSPWTIRSDAQNRILRTTVTVDPKDGRVLGRQNFNQIMLLDRIVGIGVAAHEGQLFGWMNQLLGLVTAVGLVLLSSSAVVLWWRRRHAGVLGAPLPVQRPRWGFGLVAAVAAFAVYLPAFALSLLATVLLERFVLRRSPGASHWLGIAQPKLP